MILTGLFSTFDPANSIMSANWLMVMVPSVLLFSLSMGPNKAKIVKTTIKEELSNELNNTLGSLKTKEASTVLISIFMLIACVNAWALLPSTFSPTAHIAVNLPLAFFAWATSIQFFLMKKTKISLAHLVPVGTPTMLMPVMVVIELVSNLIRPITLSVRLTANMIAGHILISLSENLINSGNSPLILSILMMTILFMLESAVAVIQAYIFVTLVSMYLSENH